MKIDNDFENKVFHNTELLLKNYRDVVWSLEVAIHNVNKNFYIEYGCDINRFLDMAYDAGMELRGTDIEAHTKSIEKSRNMLRIVDSAVDLLRRKHKNGEIYYWILYYTGTTSDLIVNMLREAGAREVHVRISAPPFLHPCYFGTDIPSEDQLIAHNRTVEDIRRIIGADSLAYLRLDRLSQMAGGLPVCAACFDGRYPVDPPAEDIRGSYER